MVIISSLDRIIIFLIPLFLVSRRGNMNLADANKTFKTDSQYQGAFSIPYFISWFDGHATLYAYFYSSSNFFFSLSFLLLLKICSITYFVRNRSCKYKSFTKIISFLFQFTIVIIFFISVHNRFVVIGLGAVNPWKGTGKMYGAKTLPRVFKAFFEAEMPRWAIIDTALDKLLNQLIN